MRLSFFCLVVVVCFGCKHRDAVVPGPFILYRSVVYGADTGEQNMDVYLPPAQSGAPVPVIVVVHGGAWVRGTKNDFYGTSVDTFFTANGCAVAIINYRLDDKYKYPAPVDDIGLVLDKIKSKALEWNIDPNRVCIMARSSGSQLAMMYAYTRNQDGRVKAVLDLFGPTDLLDSTIVDKPLSANVSFMLGPLDSNRQAWHDASPLFFTSHAVPTAIFQGTADSTVFFIQSQMLEDSLQAHNVPSVFYTWQGASHGWYEEQWKECRESAMEWLRRYL